MKEKSGAGARPFAWQDLSKEAAPEGDSEDLSAGARSDRGSAPLTDPAAGVRPYRWGELEDGAPFPGGDAGLQAGGLPGQERAPTPVELAQREAEAILDQARREAQELREKGRAEGLEAGRAEGRRALAQAAEGLEAVARELVGHKPGLYDEAREQVVELCLALVGRLLGPLAEGDEEAVVRVVERALLLLSDRETLTVRVNPQDLRSLLDAKPQILETLDGIQKLTVLEDPAVRRGGCLVQTPASEIDARLETQLAELARTLRSS